MDIDFKVWSYNNTLPLDSLHSSTSTFKAHPYSSTQTVFHFLFQYITKLLWAILLISDSCSCDKKERASWMVSISMHGLENKMKTSDKDMAIPSSLHYIIIEIKTRRNTIYSINIESKPYTYFAIFLVEIQFFIYSIIHKSYILSRVHSRLLLSAQLPLSHTQNKPYPTHKSK